MQFKNLSLTDIPFVRPYFEKYYDGSCDMTVGGTFIWRDYYKTEFAVYKDTIVLRENKNGSYGVPMGENCEEVLRMLGKATYSFVSEKNKDIILSVFPNAVCREDRDSFDYIYDSVLMTELRGKSLSGQRNHINRFKREYENYAFEDITDDNIEKAREFFERYSKKAVKSASSAVEDRQKTFEVLDNYTAYGMLGGMLTVDGEVIGASIGEIIADTIIVHIEKALVEYHGAYPMLTNMFNRRFAAGVRFINREDDAGDEGLRKNKLSYCPVKLLKKYNIEIR